VNAVIKDNPYLVHLVVLVPFVFGAFFLMNSAQEASEIARRQQVATGVLVAHKMSNHDRWEFRFQVEARGYSGLDRVRGGTPRIGEAVTIYYDPRDPTTNSLITFEERSNGFRGPALAILLLSAFLAGVVLLTGTALGAAHSKPKPPVS
jgi:hypothetical protein